jgi:hypothetical protein
LSNQQNFTKIYLCAILIPPIYRIIKRHDSLLDKVGILGSELFRVVASDDTEEGKVTFDILAPMVLKDTKTEDAVELSLRLGLLYMDYDMWLSLLV